MRRSAKPMACFRKNDWTGLWSAHRLPAWKPEVAMTFKEHKMNATKSFFEEPGVPEAWVRLAHALMFGPLVQAGYDDRSRRHDVAPKPRMSWGERLDAWFARQRQREREAYLAEASDIFDLEERIRRLERSDI